VMMKRTNTRTTAPMRFERDANSDIFPLYVTDVRVSARIE
jgi:hypothetical protein